MSQVIHIQRNYGAQARGQRQLLAHVADGLPDSGVVEVAGHSVKSVGLVEGRQVFRLSIGLHLNHSVSNDDAKGAAVAVLEELAERKGYDFRPEGFDVLTPEELNSRNGN